MPLGWDFKAGGTLAAFGKPMRPAVLSRLCPPTFSLSLSDGVSAWYGLLQYCHPSSSRPSQGDENTEQKSPRVRSNIVQKGKFLTGASRTGQITSHKKKDPPPTLALAAPSGTGHKLLVLHIAGCWFSLQVLIPCKWLSAICDNMASHPSVWSLVLVCVLAWWPQNVQHSVMGASWNAGSGPSRSVGLCFQMLLLTFCRHRFCHGSCQCS